MLLLRALLALINLQDPKQNAWWVKLIRNKKPSSKVKISIFFLDYKVNMGAWKSQYVVVDAQRKMLQNEFHYAPPNHLIDLNLCSKARPHTIVVKG